MFDILRGQSGLNILVVTQFYRESNMAHRKVTRGNIFHNPVCLLSFLLVPFKAKSVYIITNSSLPMHCLCYKTQIQQGIKSDCTPSSPLPIPLNSLQVTTINSLVYILSRPFPCFLHPLPSPTQSLLHLPSLRSPVGHLTCAVSFISFISLNPKKGA